MFGGSFSELQNILVTQDEEEPNFNMLAQDLFGSTIQDIIDAENKVLTSTDEEINWEAPVHDIIEQLDENDNNEDVESDIEEDMVPLVDNMNDALHSLMEVKKFALRKRVTVICFLFFPNWNV